MQQNVVKELNAVLKGERMAVESYERFIRDTKDENLRREFESFQQDHIRHAGELAARITELGGRPEGDTGVAGSMADAYWGIRETLGIKQEDILKKAYDGEDKGIAKVEEIIKGDLDDHSHQLVQRLLEEDHRHLVRMAHMLADYENKQ